MRVFPLLGPLAACLLGVASLLAQSFVTGRVYQRQGNGIVPVPHARVEARSGASDKLVTEVTADDFGSFVLQGLPTAEIVVMVSHPRFHAVNHTLHEKRTLRCPAQDSCGVLDFEMTPNGELAVRVVDTLGEPIEDVAVTVEAVNKQDTSNRQPAGVFDGRGVLHIILPPGHYQVHADPAKRLRGIQYETTTTEIELEHGHHSKMIEIVLPSSRKYRVSGRVVGLQPADAQRMMITLTPLSADRAADELPQRFGAPLDRSGYFALNGLPRGSYNVELTSLREISLPASASRSYRLQAITVDEDLRGILLTAPAGATSN